MITIKSTCLCSRGNQSSGKVDGSPMVGLHYQLNSFARIRKRLSDKESLVQQLHEIIEITVLALRGTTLSTFSVNEQMSWTANRQSKREDKAYSLLGIFDIYMPLIYGKRVENVFRRLQEEVDKLPRKHHVSWGSNSGKSNMY